MRDWSVLIATHNRAPALRETLRRIPGGVEVVVVDNASTDGTPAMVREARPDAVVIALRENLGPVAKTLGLERATRPLVASLDDDAAPLPGAWDAMRERFERDPALGCAGWGVRLEDGSWECAALPRVFVGAACAFRREALAGVGGWDTRWFMQAEEYDLAFRLSMAGWGCDVFHELPALHRKTALARRPLRTIGLDARNNAVLAHARLPEPWSAMLAEEWALRYRVFGRMGAGWRGARTAARGTREGAALAREIGRGAMPERVFEDWFHVDAVRDAMRRLRADGAQRVALARWGKNAPVFLWAAQREGLDVACLADDRLRGAGVRRWRGVPVRTTDEALREGADVIVIADSAPIHASVAAAGLRERAGVPVVVVDELDVAALERAHGAAGIGRAGTDRAAA